MAAIKYEKASDIDQRLFELVVKLGMGHINFSQLTCFRSFGSKSRYTIARCHTLPKILQKAIGSGAHYVIEIISEKFDRLSFEQQTKVLIHELLHIPKSFSGGFRHHDYVCDRTVNKMYEEVKRNIS